MLPQRLELAKQQDMTFDDLLRLLLNDEISRRDSTAALRRAMDGGLDPSAGVIIASGRETSPGPMT